MAAKHNPPRSVGYHPHAGSRSLEQRRQEEEQSVGMQSASKIQTPQLPGKSPPVVIAPACGVHSPDSDCWWASLPSLGPVEVAAGYNQK